MKPERDYRTRELTSLKLALRRDLVLSPQIGARSHYVLEDPLHSRYYKVGPREYAFLSLLDGQTTVGQALRLLAQQAPRQAISEQEAAVICHWLLTTQLATSASTSGGQGEAEPLKEFSRVLKRCNPLSLRLPLCHPDRWLNWLQPRFGWCFSTAASVLWLLLLLFAAYRLSLHAERLAACTQGLFARENWVWLGLSWLALKCLHELAHGIVCKRHGGTVREAGVMFVLLAPIAYIDVTSAWRFRSKWARVHTAAAGMYAELFVAAVAALVWSSVAPGKLAYLCFNIMVMASLTTVLFNANPLMRFDGYYLLTDALELPNLYGTSQQLIKGWLLRVGLGMETAVTPLPFGRKVFALVYGLAAAAWRVALSLSLFLAAATFFHGLGVLLLAATFLIWLGVGVAEALPAWKQRAALRPPDWRRGLLLGGSLAGSLLLLLVVPWPAPYTAPAVVEFAPLQVVRTTSPGFLRECRVQPLQRVQPGDVLAVLENPELTFELEDLRREYELSRLKCRRLEQESKLAELQAEQKQLETLETRRREKEAEFDSLTLRASMAGQVLGRGFEALLGTHFKAGTELLALGRQANKEVRLSIAQDDVQSFLRQQGKALRISLPDQSALRGTLTRVEPRASVAPPHASLCAPYGGPLEVRPRDQVPSAEGADPASRYEFLEPRFVGIVTLDAAQSARGRAGQLASVAHFSQHESVGGHLVRRLQGWFEDRLEYYGKKR